MRAPSSANKTQSARLPNMIKLLKNNLIFLVCYLILLASLILVYLWPRSAYEESQQTLIDAQSQLLARGKALEQSASNLDNVLLKTRVGVINDVRGFGSAAENLRNQREQFIALLNDPVFDTNAILRSMSPQITSLVDTKFNLAMQFSQHHSQLKNAIKRARRLHEETAQVLVDSGNINAIDKLDLLYQLSDALNNWTNFNQKEYGEFITQNHKKLLDLRRDLEKPAFKKISDYSNSLQTTVREQKKTNELLDQSISIKAISLIGLEQAFKRNAKQQKDILTPSFTLIDVLIIVLGAFISVTLAQLFLAKKLQLVAKMFQRNRTDKARLLRRSRSHLLLMGERIQTTAGGYKDYQTVIDKVKKIKSIWKDSNMTGEERKRLLVGLFQEFENSLKLLSPRELQHSLVECTEELDEFEQALREYRKHSLRDQTSRGPVQSIIGKIQLRITNFKTKKSSDEVENKKVKKPFLTI